ncbi:exopolysaccharide Pel transporter PelG [Candidatus Auribacterota bacterium]
MAGIGFKIEKLLKKNTYTGLFQAGLYSTFIGVGPWLFSIVTIFCLSYFNPPNISEYEIQYFRVTIIYVFCFSLIVVGIFYLSVSRYVADQLYLKKDENLLPIFNSVTLLVLSIQAVTGWILFSHASKDPVTVLLSIMIYMSVSMIWVVMVFLSVLSNYVAIAIGYGIGSVVAIFGGLVLGRFYGLNGYLGGYFIGQFIIVFMLAARFYIEFTSRYMFDKDVFWFILYNPRLVLAGVFYNTAIWIDKIVFWMSPRAEYVAPVLRSYPIYEVATFYAFMTICPSVVVFLVVVETRFFNKFKYFYANVVNKGTFTEVRQAKKVMLGAMIEMIGTMVKIQGVVTVLAVTFVPLITQVLRIESKAIPVFQVTCLGVFVHSMLLTTIVGTLYFDQKTLAVLISLVFCVTNGVFTWITVYMPVEFTGYGYFFSAMVSLIFAFYVLDHKMRRLEYITFALQPVTVPSDPDA